MPTYTPTLPGEAFSWESQAKQYERIGPPNKIVYFAGEIGDGYPPVDCLLAYDDNGRLVGILNHYPVDIPPWEKAGNVSIFIDPTMRRQGLATSLWREARRRWGVTLAGQKFTNLGATWASVVSEREGWW